jgi:two-component sensor histidine kinase
MKELIHRIKNNLQLISSFINLQLTNVQDEQARSILTDSTNRIASISLLHDYLFKSSKLNVVNVQEYLYKIVDHIKATLQTNSAKIKISKDIDNFEINSGLAISMGLVVNEIITNAVKHAFKNQRDKIISLELKQKDDNILLVIRDNGIGMEKSIDFEKASTLGFQILHALVSQHKGTIECNVKNGTEFLINLPLTNNT